jgi:transcriptional regulator with XRE-family HTH domain
VERDSIQRAVGKAIRRRRETAGLSQEALAAESGLHRTYIGSVERGERNLSLQNLQAISGALNCTASELLHEAESLADWQGSD